MSARQITINVSKAIVIPSLVGMPENPDTGPDFLVRMRAYVENPENMVQLRLSRDQLLEMFKGVDFFNQEDMVAFHVTVSGILDHPEQFPQLSRRYEGSRLSIKVSAMNVIQTPILDLPSNILRIVRTAQSSESAESSSSSSSNESSTSASGSVSPVEQIELPTQRPRRDISSSPDFMMANPSLDLPRVRRRKLIRRQALSTPTAAMPGSMMLAQFATSMATFPLKKPPGSGRIPPSSRQVPAPSDNQLESSSAAQQQRQDGSEETTTTYMPVITARISDTAESFSSQALTNVSERSSDTVTAPTSVEIPESSSVSRTRPIQRRKRQRDTDQDQAEDERSTRRSSRIRERKNKAREDTR